MGHDQEDDPGSSCYIKREPADEGIYASTRRERTFAEIFGPFETESGLTLQPMIQSSDPKPTHAPRSLTAAEQKELDELLGWGSEPELPPQEDHSFSQFLYDDADTHPSISGQQPPSFAEYCRVSQPEKSGPPTSSVSALPSGTTTAKPRQQPSQSDCSALASSLGKRQRPSDPSAPPPDQGEQYAALTSLLAQSNSSASSPGKRQQLSESLAPPDLREQCISRTTSPSQSDCSALTPPPSKRQRLSYPSAPRPDQAEQRRESRTPSPAQSNGFVSASQSPARSETPPTPIDDDFVLSELFGDFGQEEVSAGVEHRQRPLATDVISPQSQTLVGSLQATERNLAKPIPVVDLTDEHVTTTRSLLSNDRNNHALRASFHTPIPSIECNTRADSTQPTTSSNPRGSQPSSQPNANSEAFTYRAKLNDYLAHKQEHKGNRSSHTSKNPSPTRFDPSMLHKFSTFMKLRNSLPISAIMAMMAPPNQTQVLAALTELSSLEKSPGVTQPATHEIPAEMRAMLDNLKRKFNSDKSFLKSVIIYATEQLIGNDQGEGKSVDRDSVLRIGLNGLTTVEETREQLFKERSHYHEILSNQEYVINRLKKEIGKSTASLTRNTPGYNPGTSSTTHLAPTSSPQTTATEPQLELNGDGPIKNNPYWVCSHVMFDGSGLPCNGINQEWYRPHSQRQGIAPKWTQRQICAKCSRPNKTNRRYLTDTEARMFSTLFATGQQKQVPAATVHQTMLQPAMTPPMAQYPMVQWMPAMISPFVQHPMMQPMPPLAQNPLRQSTPAYTSPYVAQAAPAPRKRNETAPAPPSKPHPGFAITPAVQQAIRRELPMKEWMKEKGTIQVQSDESGAADDDMASLFGEDEEVSNADLEAELIAALDEALAS
ncbi:uncharacterized protein K444DRAFT_90223 [Hyaloscypha bicolor E]|uniref:Uncharacterized protein n=1 Tax=Hyaloscypha bicolor E TaxID=1095630 RepID=A0A2J6SXR0_9HELO|nr:uncharacterized protein K444DRAFT_90223 [Hyaloscypha bicolor E]PMD55541.1 hypothetical protein K444DRAFT_90223 [Hyaloscypha bicolor E]